MEERDKLDQKIQLLQEERLLIDKHLKNQEVKEEEVRCAVKWGALY